MAQQDIVPGLLDEIEEAFEEKVNSNRTIKQIEEKISKKTAQLKDGHAYAQELGESLSGVLQEKITPETLPDGKLYWNIADRTVRPMLEQNHKLVNDTAVEIQSIQDEKDGIELQPVRGEFPEERIHGLIDKMVEEPDVEKALGFLGEPIVNNTAAFFDQFIEANADFRHKAGLHEVIERVGTPGACPWCAALAGTRDYSPGMDRDVFRRHENCRCLVTFKSGKRRQNVWSKELWEEEDEIDNVEKSTQNDIMSAENHSKAYNDLVKVIEKDPCEYVEVQDLQKPLPESRIINRLGGGDMTDGSCASLAYAYAGNKAGWDVLDFRGGISQSHFASQFTKDWIIQFDNVKSIVSEDYNAIKNTLSMLGDIEPKKEYILCVGKHAAVIRKMDNGAVEYLELQTEKENGWYSLDNSTLEKRFKAKRSKRFHARRIKQKTTLIDVESLGNSSDFKSILGYLNTNTWKQKKGVGGYAK